MLYMFGDWLCLREIEDLKAIEIERIGHKGVGSTAYFITIKRFLAAQTRFHGFTGKTFETKRLRDPTANMI